MISSPIASIKQDLLEMCRQFAAERIAAIKNAIAEAQLAANEETKSSSGDKYETGRAMAQLEMEKNSKQLGEAQAMMQQLLLIDSNDHRVVKTGSLVITSSENYFISIAAGRLVSGDESYYAVSAASPVAKLMIGKKKGDIILLKDKSFRIEKVC